MEKAQSMCPMKNKMKYKHMKLMIIVKNVQTMITKNYSIIKHHLLHMYHMNQRKIYCKRRSKIPVDKVLTKIENKTTKNYSSDSGSTTEMGNACKGDVQKSEDPLDDYLGYFEGINFTVRGGGVILQK